MRMLIPCLTTALFLTTNGDAQVWRATHHVSPHGVDRPSCGLMTNPPCKSISYAVNEILSSPVQPSDILIKVERGFYQEAVLINQSVANLTIQGGWNEDFTERSEDPSETRILGRGGPEPSPTRMRVEAQKGENIEVTVEGFRFDENVSAPIEATSRSGGSVTFSVIGNRILRNAISNTGIQSPGVSVYSETSGIVTLNLIGNEISDNFFLNGGTGGGLRVTSTLGSRISLLIERNIIKGNQADSGGGIALYSNYAFLDARLVNNIISGNRATLEWGGGVWLSSTNGGDMRVSMENNTITGNSAEFGGGGIAVRLDESNQNSRVEIQNTILWGNTAWEGNDIRLNSGTLSISYSNVGDVYRFDGTYNEGQGLLNQNPQFLIPTFNFHLKAASPMIDRGLCGIGVGNLYLRYAPYDDIDGDPRPGYGERTGCDIGADERFVHSLLVPVYQNAWYYNVVGSPVKNSNPASCQPIGVGDLSSGTLNLQVGLPGFQSKVDVYLAFFSEALGAQNIFLITEGNGIVPFQGVLIPWMVGTDGNVDEVVFGNIPLSALPKGTYHVYLAVTPAGVNDLSQYTLWSTQFSVP